MKACYHISDVKCPNCDDSAPSLGELANVTQFLNQQILELREQRAALTEEITRLKQAARRIITQDYGRRNAWAGMWTNCESCKSIFAYSWNWSDDPEYPAPKECPICRMAREFKIEPGRF